jgi:hypothetical protein
LIVEIPENYYVSQLIEKVRFDKESIKTDRKSLI